jgi:hypothetical protein
MFKISFMEQLPSFSQTIESKKVNSTNNILVIGINRSLISNLPKGCFVIDSSLLKIKEIDNTDHIFETKNLQTFNLHKKFANIISLNSLHLEKELEKIICCIFNHLEEEAILYFPLAPNSLIHNYLLVNNLIPKDFCPTFQYRTRQSIEDAVLKLPFSSILIEEKVENFHFSTKEELYLYLLDLLPKLCDLKEKILENTAKGLSKELYKEEDKILTLSSPCILLTLSREETF